MKHTVFSIARQNVWEHVFGLQWSQFNRWRRVSPVGCHFLTQAVSINAISWHFLNWNYIQKYIWNKIIWTVKSWVLLWGKHGSHQVSGFRHLENELLIRHILLGIQQMMYIYTHIYILDGTFCTVCNKSTIARTQCYCSICTLYIVYSLFSSTLPFRVLNKMFLHSLCMFFSVHQSFPSWQHFARHCHINTVVCSYKDSFTQIFCRFMYIYFQVSCWDA